MSREYKLSTLLYQMPSAELEKFFQSLHLLQHFDFNGFRRSQRHLLEQAIEELSLEDQAVVAWNLRDINTLCSKEGSEIIEECVSTLAPSRLLELDACPGPYSRAMWLYLEFGKLSGDLFEHCLILNMAQSQRFPQARRLRSLPGIVPNTTDLAVEDLQRAVAAAYKDHGHGAGCHIKYARRESPTRHYFVASQEDVSQTKFLIQGDDLRRVGQRGTVMVVYVYYPEQGVLELAAPGGMERARALHESFCRVVLKMPHAPVQDRGRSKRLNVVRAPSFAFERELEDNISSIVVTGVRLTDIYDIEHRLSHEGAVTESQPFEAWLRATLVEVKPDLRFWDISTLRIRATFGNGGRGNQVTFTVTDSGVCSLKDKPNHLLLKRYLRRWKLMH